MSVPIAIKLVYWEMNPFRYYLLHVAKSNQDLDMSKLTKISFWSVWITEMFFLPICQLPPIISLLMNGWPAISIASIVETNRGVLIRLLFATALISNIPDYLSLLLYIRMFTLTKQSVQPVNHEQELPYGGIWVGDNDPQVEAIINAQSNNANQVKMRSILKMLQWNTTFCLIDLAAGLIWDHLVCQGTFAHIVAYTFQTLVCFWIPMLVLGSNFKWFDSGLCSCTSERIIEIVCWKPSSKQNGTKRITILIRRFNVWTLNLYMASNYFEIKRPSFLFSIYSPSTFLFGYFGINTVLLVCIGLPVTRNNVLWHVFSNSV